MDDNFIPKEFMSVAYNAAQASTEESDHKQDFEDMLKEVSELGSGDHADNFTAEAVAFKRA